MAYIQMTDRNPSDLETMEELTEEELLAINGGFFFRRPPMPRPPFPPSPVPPSPFPRPPVPPSPFPRPPFRR